MKFILMTAALVMGTPALAQNMTSQEKSMLPGNNLASQMPGYQPAQPPVPPGTPAGTPVVFQQAPAPDVAYPPPPPMESYPICKRGQFDKCKQPGGV